jgi:hypothetical protein
MVSDVLEVKRIGIVWLGKSVAKYLARKELLHHTSD